jgi:hypothetical protein
MMSTRRSAATVFHGDSGELVDLVQRVRRDEERKSSGEVGRQQQHEIAPGFAAGWDRGGIGKGANQQIVTIAEHPVTTKKPRDRSIP